MLEMKKMMFIFRNETRIILKSPSFYLCIVGVAFSMLLSLEDNGIGTDVLGTYLTSVSLSGHVLAYVFASGVYARVFCEEMEHKYLYYILTRITRIQYVCCKLILIFLSSITTIILGEMLFCVLVRIFVPWSIDSSSYRFLLNSTFGLFLKSEHYILFFVCNSIFQGMFSGMLSLMAAYISLFVSNRIIVLCSPLLCFEVLCLLSYRISIPAIFVPVVKTFSLNILNLLAPLAISLLSLVIFIFLFCMTLKERILVED